MKLVKQELDELGFLVAPPVEFQYGEFGAQAKNPKKLKLLEWIPLELGQMRKSSVCNLGEPSL